MDCFSTLADLAVASGLVILGLLALLVRALDHKRE